MTWINALVAGTGLGCWRSRQEWPPEPDSAHRIRDAVRNYFIYDWWPIRNRGRLFERMSRMEVSLRQTRKAD